jgi:hypothetical protein
MPSYLYNNSKFFPNMPQEISYLDIAEKNIFDTRFTGGGKTSSALKFISRAVADGQSVIVLMQSYVRLENNYISCFDGELRPYSLLFKGKTQEGICNYWKELQEAYGQDQRMNAKSVTTKTIAHTNGKRIN